MQNHKNINSFNFYFHNIIVYTSKAIHGMIKKNLK